MRPLIRSGLPMNLHIGLDPDGYTMYLPQIMKTTVQRWGNSLAIRIPSAVIKEARLAAGSEMRMAWKDGRIVLVPVKQRKYSLRQLLSQVKGSNLHPEVDSGPARGKEAW